MAQTINIPRDSTLQELVEAVRSINTELKNNNIIDALDGTAATYKKLMRKWFVANGANEATPAELTALCDKWYTITREPWHGYTTFYQPDVSAVSTGTRGGDSVGLSCTPSTDTVAGQDDFAGLPLFACVDCNFVVDAETLEPQITAIDGITDNFRRSSPDAFVGVLQMSGYVYQIDYDTTYTVGYSSLRDVPIASIAPLDEAIRVDGSVRPWVVHSKYFNHTVDNKLTSYSGAIPTAYTISHNTVHTLAQATGVGYSGGTTADDAFLKIMAYIKYASLTLDGILQGCCNNDYQYKAAVSENGVKRVLLTESQAAVFEPGMGVLIGSTNNRNTDTTYDITGQAGAIVTRVETVNVSGTNYGAVYVDMETSFNTTADTTYISTFHWKSGMTDGVLGNDGSPTNNTSGKYPAKLQGIEYMVGAHEVFADVILNLTKDDEDKYWCEPYVCRRSANQTTSITENYEASGLKFEQPTADVWRYIRKFGYRKGVMFPIDVAGGSSTTYARDAFSSSAATVSTREWRAHCTLNSTIGTAGLFAGCGRNTLISKFWSIITRLSPNGNRGEWAS